MEVTNASAPQTPVRTYQPVTDIFETADGVRIEMEMPGVAAADLDVDLENHVLSVRSSAHPLTPKGFDLVHAEYAAGNFERAFTLSETVDPSKIEARMQDGILTLILPRAEEAQARKIDVKAG